MENFDLVVASHLRWDFVWQRPQQILSRLSHKHRVLFVEEPTIIPDGVEPEAELQVINCTLSVLKPQVPQSQAGDTPACLWPCEETIVRQLKDALRRLNFQRYALWFYTPTPEFLARKLQPEMVVCDVMDDLASFKYAPPQLREREQRLLSQASVVFTGGYSLFESKKRHNSNTHLFASGVDSHHYRTACHPKTTVPDWVDRLPGPRATYIGVIDERMDYDLIAAMAEHRPDVQFLMCGPIVKVDPNHLPKAPNLHYPGQQEYNELPRILKGSDVCLMPFARNEATRFISPTKTLEYLATKRPVVSTPIADVERFYSDIVYLAHEPKGFVDCIDRALQETEEEKERKSRRIEAILAEHAWDAIAESMSTLMERAAERQERERIARKAAVASMRRTPAPNYGAMKAQ